jgi:glycosyltransferase involved in cell wall biosynthesis
VTVPDFSLARFPEWHTRDKVRYFQKNFWAKIGRADHVIFLSEFIRKEAIDVYGFPSDRLTVIYPGFDREIFKPYPQADLLPLRRQYDLPPKFILYVGSIEPRKNLKNLLRAYRNLNRDLRKDYKLVLAGFKGWENQEIMAVIRELKEDVYYLGYLPDTDLGKLYGLAELFVYPSFYEGFGLPPLEAMACGCPVIVSRAASLPEVCGDAAYYVDPLEPSSIRKGMGRVLTEELLRTALISKGLARVAEFSWEKSARAHLAVFEEVCGSQLLPLTLRPSK